MDECLEIKFGVDRLKVGIYYMCRRLLDKIESTETGIIVCVMSLSYNSSYFKALILSLLCGFVMSDEFC